MFTCIDYAFLENIWDPLTVSPEDFIFTKPNLTSGSQETNILFLYIDDFQCNYSSGVAMVEAVDIVSKNIDASINNMDIDNVLFQDFLHKPTISDNCLGPEGFKGNWTNPDLTFALFNKIIRDLDQYIRSEKPISDNPPNGVDILDEILVFSPLGDFVLNKQLAEQADKQIDELLNKQPGQHGNE